MLPRENYPMVIKTELEQLDFEIEKLQAMIDKSADAAKAEYADMLDLMRSKLAQAQRKLEALEQASDKNWEEVKADLDTTRDALKSILAQTAQKLQSAPAS